MPRHKAGQPDRIEDVFDLWAIERAGIFSAVPRAGGTLSALDGRGPRELGIDRLIQRVTRFEANGQASPPDEAGEIILATSATVDGQTTAHYIAERLEHLPVKVTRLAHGVPVGGELNYLDDGHIGPGNESQKPVIGCSLSSPGAVLSVSAGSLSGWEGSTGSGGVLLTS